MHLVCTLFTLCYFKDLAQDRILKTRVLAPLGWALVDIYAVSNSLSPFLAPLLIPEVRQGSSKRSLLMRGASADSTVDIERSSKDSYRVFLGPFWYHIV